MNIILITKDDFISDEIVVLKDRRYIHIRDVHNAQPGKSLRIGVINGKIGHGEVITIDSNCVQLAVSLTNDALPPLPLTLILALPRPKMLKRILQCAASLGVKDIYLINSYKVDKSYWSSPVLNDESLYEHLQLGLEQAVTTHLPRIHFRKRFKPFVEDELTDIAKDSEKLVAHPYQAKPCPIQIDKKTTLVIGPEGGFIEYEIDKLSEINFEAISLGKRILRVETAIPYAIAKLFSC
jgi:RsmE family RNA methyltransferase